MKQNKIYRIWVDGIPAYTFGHAGELCNSNYHALYKRFRDNAKNGKYIGTMNGHSIIVEKIKK